MIYGQDKYFGLDQDPEKSTDFEKAVNGMVAAIRRGAPKDEVRELLKKAYQFALSEREVEIANAAYRELENPTPASGATTN